MNALAIKAFWVALLASVLVFGGCRWQAKLDAGSIAKATARADKAEADIAQIAKLTREAADRAKTASARIEVESANADKALKEKTDEAKRTAADLADALRTGERRLRGLWACPAPGAAQGGDPADAGASDAAGRADSAGRIAGAVAADAATMTWLYDRWAAEHKAVIGAGCAVEAQP